MLRLAAVFASLLTFLAAPRLGRAEFPNPSMYIGLFGGYNRVMRDWDLRESTKPLELTPDHSGMAGMRLGFHILAWLVMEGEVSYLPAKSKMGGGQNHILGFNFDLLIHLGTMNWAPFIEGGFGGYASLSGDLGKDIDPRAHAGIGLRGLLAPWLALRIGARDVFSDGYDKWGANNIEIHGGLDFFLWRGSYAPPDKDEDGVPDASDACPDTKGTAATQGCPDRDGDGIANKDDRCPNQAGLKELQGCPDRDGDRIADAEDRCPDEKGPVAFHGCPDSDGDGITDSKDRCPKQKGPANLKGCPDTDGDSIPDIDDACPRDVGPVALNGCPDKDGDGVPDKDDKCPDVPGLKELQGCMPPAAKKFTGVIKGIYFATGSAKIKRRSFALLDEAVKLLKEYPSMKLSIEGHTDSRGKPARNQALSQARADSVRDHLVKAGIAADRLSAKGFGPDKPIASNRTARGRAQNRRIEFSISSQ